MTNQKSKIFETNSVEETKKLAKKLAVDLAPGSILALVGDLGSGKTSFVQGLAEGLNISEKIPVSSPTFVLIHEYPGGRLPLYHFDFYRLKNKEEAFGLGLEEYFEGDGITVVEWADRFKELFPETTQWVHFKIIGEEKREIS
ncbi:MAG: tRNA (adenosine(37)-N6)-threonylcarbamoyltransferase complex ATPase subunit type 1 TsaE [Deltaproteobacteria bacterium]|nr:tRNA (adenosine(37)-N6)-threonylcarbamoyltransferase complex ATPase subunit type 1 TsaE [Deltaproteobacteria bacterium]